MALGHPRARHLLTGAGSTPRIQHGGPSVSIIQWFRELNRGWPTATRPSVRNWTSNRIIIGDLASISIVVESICGWVTKDRSGAEGPPFSLRAPVKFVIALGLFPYYWICRANCLLFHGISPSHETIPPPPPSPPPPKCFRSSLIQARFYRWKININSIIEFRIFLTMEINRVNDALFDDNFQKTPKKLFRLISSILGHFQLRERPDSIVRKLILNQLSSLEFV